MLIERKEKIIERIKYLCENDKVDVDFNEIEVGYSADIINNYNHGRMRCYVTITNIKEDFSYYLEDREGLEPAIVAVCALRGYVMYKKDFYQTLEEEQRKEEYKKKHPILIKIKEYFGGF